MPTKMMKISRQSTSVHECFLSDSGASLSTLAQQLQMPVENTNKGVSEEIKGEGRG